MPTRQRSKTSTDPSTPQPDTSTGTSPEAKPAEAEGPAEEQADAPLTEEEWAKARLELLASLPEEKDRPKNIYGRLAQITSFIHQIRKSGWNSFHRYKYAKESDLVEAIRPILAEYGIVFEQGLAYDPELKVVGHKRLTKTIRDKDRNIIGTAEDLTAVTIRTRFVWWNPDGWDPDLPIEDRGDKPTGALETTEYQFWAGYGDDGGDKGIYKAITGAVKYALMKTFLVSTGDDPEGDTNTDARAAAREASGPVTVERGGAQGRRPPAAGGKQENTTQPQRKVFKDLMKRAGAKNAKEIIEKLQTLLPGLTIKVDGEDYAGALVTFMEKAPGASLGTAITKLQAELGEGEPPASPLREEEAPVATDDTAELDAAAPDAAAADGWESEDKEGSDDAVAGLEPTDAADDGALTGDDAAAV